MDYRFSMADGKVLSQYYGIHFSRCFICFCPPTYMNKYEQWLTHPDYNMNPDAMLHNFRPLHAMIGICVHLINLSTKRDLLPSKSQARGADADKAKEYRRVIQQEMIEKMNLRVEFPNPDGGTTTNGNVARRAFENPELFASILKLDEELVKIISLLLTALRSTQGIRQEEFERLCNRAKDIYDSKYKNIPKSSKLHQLLEHGPDILAYSILPPAFYSEEGLESNNKISRDTRTRHARLDTRKHNIQDVFQANMVRTDPVISKFGLYERQKKKKILNVSPELRKLLILDENPGNDEQIPEEPHELFCDDDLELTIPDETGDNCGV